MLSQEETRNIKIVQQIERRIAEKKKKFEEFNKNASKRADSEDTKDLIVSTNHMKLAHDEAEEEIEEDFHPSKKEKHR